VYSKHSTRVRRLLRKFIFVLHGINPRERGDGKPLVGFEGRSLNRALRGSVRNACRECQRNGDDKHHHKRRERSSHPVIIDFSHLDAFDSWGTFRVALRFMRVRVCRRSGPEPRFLYFIYSLLMGLAAIALLPYWLVQGLRHGKYLSNLLERLGLSFPSLGKLPTDRAGAIWIHAVSVGEALSSLTLARHLKDTYPNRPLIVSTTTITGQALARGRLSFADAIVYFPLDWTWCVRRALDAVQPAIVVILETEIWPNFLREAGRRHLTVVFVSGRISDRSFRRWQRQISRF